MIWRWSRWGVSREELLAVGTAQAAVIEQQDTRLAVRIPSKYDPAAHIPLGDFTFLPELFR